MHEWDGVRYGLRVPHLPARVAAGQDEPPRRLLLRLERLVQPGSAHLRHHQVGDDQVDLLRVGPVDLEPLLAVGRLQHRVPVALQRAPAGAAERILVLHQQDRLRAAAHPYLPLPAGGW